MKPLVVIPARGGSQRLPRKNILPLAGKPMIQHTIEAAREVFDDSVICVSTDDNEIKYVSEQDGFKVPFVRPKELATATADTRSVLIHAYEHYKDFKKYEADLIVLLQPTSPLRKGHHIEEALKLFSDELDMVVSVKETDANPYFVLFEENDVGYLEKSKEGNYSRSQDCPKVYELNGAIYIINLKSLLQYQPTDFKRIVKYIMDNNISIDIDTEVDFKLAELLFEKQ